MNKYARFALLLALAAVALFAQTHSATLTWPPNSSGDVVQNYEVFRSLTSTVSTTTVFATVAASTCTATTCTFVDTAVTAGTQYWYELEACNGAGCSAPTPAVSVTVPFQIPNTPATPTITAK
jgi:hypothetical protein